MAGIGSHAVGFRAGSWRERWCQWRNRLLSSRRFQERVAAFPLTRAVARWRARKLFDLCAGFVYSQVLLACVRLRLPELLAEGPCTPAEAAGRLGLPETGAARLLAAATSLGLAEARDGGRFGLGPRGAELLGNPGVAAMVAHHTLLYADLEDPVALLRCGGEGTRLGSYWAYAGHRQPERLGDADVAAYGELMAASQPLIAAQVLAAYPMGHHRRLLDVAGGEGAFLAAAAARWPHLELSLFELPAVAARARQRLAAAGTRVQVTPGDFRNDPLPAGADLVTLVRVLHDHDDPGALALLRAVRRALPPDGSLLVAEPLADTPGAEAVGEAYFGFYLLAMGQGRARRLDELTALLREAGFQRPRLLACPMPMLTRVLHVRPGRRMGVRQT